MLFDNAATFTKQGDIGEARAIYEYTQLGYVVSRTLFDSAPYELIVDDGIRLYRVQVRTSQCKNLTRMKKEHKGYNVNLSVSGGNTSENTRRKRKDDDYDLLFVLTEQNECWSIPIEALSDARSAIVVGNTKYNEFKLKGSVG